MAASVSPHYLQGWLAAQNRLDGILSLQPNTQVNLQGVDLEVVSLLDSSATPIYRASILGHATPDGWPLSAYVGTDPSSPHIYRAVQDHGLGVTEEQYLFGFKDAQSAQKCLQCVWGEASTTLDRVDSAELQIYRVDDYRGDRKPVARHWVKDPTVKGGGYYAGKGSKAIQPTAAQSGASAAISTAAAGAVKQQARNIQPTSRSAQHAVQLGKKAWETEQLPQKREMAQLVGEFAVDLATRPVKTFKEGMARDRMAMKILQTTGKTRMQTTRQALKKGAAITHRVLAENELYQEGGAAVGGVVGGALGGAAGTAVAPGIGSGAGTLAGDIGGTLAVRKGFKDARATKKAWDDLKKNDTFKKANILKKAAMLRQQAISELKSINEKEAEKNKDNLTGDVAGWAIGNAACNALPIPNVGMATAMVYAPAVQRSRGRIANGENSSTVIREEFARQSTMAPRATKALADGEQAVRAEFTRSVQAAKQMGATVQSAKTVKLRLIQGGKAKTEQQKVAA